jgi:hypothetical protein
MTNEFEGGDDEGENDKVGIVRKLSYNNLFKLFEFF